MKIIYKEIPWINPFDAFVQIKRDEPSFILESLGMSTKTSRYSFIGTRPRVLITSNNNSITISNNSQNQSLGGDPLETMRYYLMKKGVLNIHGLPPFIGGAVGYFGYDMVRLFENLQHKPCDDLKLPDIVFMIIDIVVAFDHKERRGWIVSVIDEDNNNADECIELMSDLEGMINKGRNLLYQGSRSHGLRIKMASNLTRKDYINMVRQCKEYISSGDIFQANLSQRLSVYIKDIDPLNIYRVLREVNPSPFSAFIDTGDMQIVSSSPERLARLSNGMVETRPIAGTRPRGRNQLENRILAEELLASDKERAEHIMLVDLERNDIGRVCRYGSITVDEFMVLESYSHVTHIVSNVTGELVSGKDVFDLIKAVFPGGTITGVPKIRCMEIIDELEPTARGPYTGSLGYISYSGDMDLNIIIRTFIIKDRWAHVQVGAGIVADSDPEKEYRETLYKAEALLKTLELI